MRKNLIITQRHGTDGHGSPFDSLENTYVDYLSAFGFTVFPIPVTTPAPDRFAAVVTPHAIVLSGGGDVNPQLYNGLGAKGLALSAERDRLESELLEFALRERVPVLGICRGMHMINVYFGGALDAYVLPTSYDEQNLLQPHRVLFDDSLLQERFPQGCEVNSYHRQAVPLNRLGNDLACFAYHAKLPLAEGVRHKQLPIAGIQWHPERNVGITPLDQFLLESLHDRRLFWEAHH